MNLAAPSGDDHPMHFPTPYDTIGTILNVHAMISGFIVQTVQDIPESRMVEQPGGVVNHPAWTLSHLNAYAGVLLAMFDDPDAPPADAEMERFGYGTIPVPAREAYATGRELLDQFTDRNARLGVVVAQRHERYFPMAAPEKFQPYSPTVGHVAVTLLVAHPPHHLGQLRQWRRAAGLAGKS